MKTMLANLKLFTSHADAWGTTLLISSTPLLLHGRADLHAWSLVIAITVGYWLGFAVNDYFDAPHDAHEPRKAARSFFVGRQPSRAALLIGTAAVTLALFGVFASFGLRGIAMFALAFAVLWAYSAPPLRLKSRPGLDLLTHAMFVQTFPYTIPLVLLQIEPLPLDYGLISLFLLTSLTAQLEQQARDYEVDCLTDRNFTTRFGLGTTTALLRGLTVGLLVYVVVLAFSGVFPPELTPFGIICLPMFAHRLIRGIHQPRSEWLFRLTLLTALGYAGWLWGRFIV
jgi:4-hydroxybenzoate polyprenyltransferase